VLLTPSIHSTKKSIVNELKRTSKTFQHFKNLIYLCAAEYYHTTKDIKPFLSKTFLEKFVKGKEKHPLRMRRINKVFFKRITDSNFCLLRGGEGHLITTANGN
jgi:hypothetical protein